ncbi:MAG: hypothetical protein H0T46_32735 [Deltaproteobacteria bacterium]|nr:hypothetical protein [Deltaproteobacteria bacterium]
MKILVVDASSDVRMRVVRSLSELSGIVVQGAVAGVGDAVRAMEDCPLDGVVTGVTFPEGDVLQLIAAAKRRHLGTVIVFAPIDSEEARAGYVAAGASHVVDGRINDLAATMQGMTEEATPDPFALVGRLAVGAAHDINNYLVAGEVALAFAERSVGGEVKKDLRQVRASFDGVARIARALTSYARGGQPVADSVELEPLVRRVLEAFGRIIPDGVRVVVEAASNVPPIRGVASELEQVVLNLVLNACEAMIWGGTLWLVIEPGAAGHVRLEVADTGRGLPPAVAGSDGATTPSSKHARASKGLGLGIVRTVIERHGGTLELGRAVGGGASITILLPA